MKIEEYAPRRHADEERQGEVLEHPVAELDRTDVEDRPDRDQGHDRGVDGAHQGLVDREVRRLGIGLMAFAEVLGVLTHLVEHYDGVVEREAEDGQHTGHRRRCHLEPGQGIDPDGDDEVVDQGDDGGHRHLPSRKYAQIRSTTQDQEDDESGDRPFGDLLAPAGADLVDGDVGLGDPDGRLDRGGDRRGLRRGEQLGLDEDGVLAGRGDHDLLGRVDARPRHALRRLSALSCVTSPLGTETVYCAPPTNSMP